MAKAPKTGILFLRRLAEQLEAQKMAAMAVREVKAAAEAGGGSDFVAKAFWMKDPKSGNWIPESHFEQIDVAELREKLLAKKKLSEG